MKSYCTAFGLVTAVIFLGFLGSAQQKDNHGKRSYTPDEVRSFCGIPVDTSQMKRILAAEDSMYHDYLVKHKNLSKVETAPNWQSMMSPVELQGCGDCWAYAATGVAEGQLHILIGSNIGINMDESDIVDNTVGCVVSYASTAWAYIGTYKAISEVNNNYPNFAGVRWGVTSSASGEAAGVQNIKTLLNQGPVSASFYVYDNFGSYFATYGPTAVYTQTSGNYIGNHAVVIVSYTDYPGGGGYWLCKNSWGDWWGDNGYFRIGYGVCGIDYLNNGYVTVDWSCVGKIVPNLFATLNSAASYNFVNNEWIVATGASGLSGNISIPYGRTLEFLPGASLNFSGYYIDASGTFLFGSGCALSTGTRYYNIYSTLATAIAAAGSGQTVTVNGPQLISSDATVSAGRTLQLNPGSSIAYGAANARLWVYGTLNVNGSVSSHVVLDGQGYSRSTYTYPLVLTFSGGTANIQYADFTNAAYDVTTWSNSGGVSIQNCSFSNFGYTSGARAIMINASTSSISVSNNSITGSNSQGTGIYIYNTGTNVAVTGNTITNCGTGVHPYSSNAFLTSNTIWNNAGFGIQADYVSTSAVYRSNDIRNSVYGLSLNSSSPWVVGNVIIENSPNVFASSSSPTFEELPTGQQQPGPGHNVVAHGPSPLVNIQNGSYACFGYDTQGGYNSFYDTDLPDFYVLSNSIAVADLNYWGGAPSLYVDGTSSALSDNPLASDPNPDPLGKRVVHAGLVGLAKGPLADSIKSGGFSLYLLGIKEGQNVMLPGSQDIFL